MELAYVSSNKIYIEIEKKQQSFLAGILKKITKRAFYKPIHLQFMN
jgi:hypothetical protein